MLARVRWGVRSSSVSSSCLSGRRAQTMRVADIADLSIEELGNIQITSVSRHARASPTLLQLFS